MQNGIRDRPPSAVDATRIAPVLRERLFRGLVIGTVAAMVLTAVGALNTDEAALPLRFAYWLAVVLPGSLLGFFVHTTIASWGGLADRRWLEMALVAIVIAIPHTFIVIVASMLMFGIDALSIGTVLGFGAIVLMFSLVLTTINYVSAGPKMPELVAPTFEDPASAAVIEPEPGLPTAEIPAAALPLGLAERLPPRLGNGRLIALEAEDHYLRVHTDLGSDIILMRMIDAVALLEMTPGARVHRSWWVARSAVEGSSSIDGRTTLQLASGIAAPVSRSARPALAAQGWFL